MGRAWHGARTPALTASSAPPPPRPTFPDTASLHHATQEHGTPPKPHPVTRAHGRRRRKVTARQEVGQRHRERLRWGQMQDRADSLLSLIIHCNCNSDVRRAGLRDREGRRGKKRETCAGVWYDTDEVGCFIAASGKL